MVDSVVIFIGPPGSGKGTISQLCVEKLGWKQLSTGNLCRQHIAAQTKIGKEIDFAIKSGKLVSDGLITDMVTGWFKSQDSELPKIILDGFPRTVGQAEAFYEFLKNNLGSVPLDIVRFCISDESVISRLSNRFICGNKDCQAVYSLSMAALAPKNDTMCDHCGAELKRRKDDEEQAVRKRLKIYYQHEQQLLDFYKNNISLNVKECNVEQPLQDVFVDFKQLVDLQPYDTHKE